MIDWKGEFQIPVGHCGVYSYSLENWNIQINCYSIGGLFGTIASCFILEIFNWSVCSSQTLAKYYFENHLVFCLEEASRVNSCLRSSEFFKRLQHICGLLWGTSRNLFYHWSFSNFACNFWEFYSISLKKKKGVTREVNRAHFCSQLHCDTF